MKKRALIMYATMSGNTEKIAKAMKEAFESYLWDVTFFKMTPNADWLGMQEQLYFDDYDVVCLGSPIVAGSPLKVVYRALSLGGDGGIDKMIADKLKKEGQDIEFGPGVTLFRWRRNSSPYPGIITKTDSHPLGIVFSTYGGGFYGSDEATATLETLKLYLEIFGVDVVGRFACCGKERGPGGYAPGVKPKGGDSPAAFMDPKAPPADVCDAKIYTNAAGETMYGSYFFHWNNNGKPSERDIFKAKALVCDLVEDYFLTYDGERWPAKSSYITIS